MPKKPKKLPARKPRKVYKKLPENTLDALPANPQMDSPEERRARLNHYFALREDGCPFEEACKQAGFSMTSFLRWVDQSADLASENEASKKRRKIRHAEEFEDIASKCKKDPRYNAIFLALLKHEGIIKDEKVAPEEVETKKYVFEVVDGEHKPK